MERPKSGVRPKTSPEDKAKRSQRLLLTWIADRPGLYDRIKKYISAMDFTEGVCQRVAERMFRELEEGKLNPAGIISMFEEESEQREAAALFSADLPGLETEPEKEKAFRDILLSVKKNSYEYHVARMGTDVSALSRAIEGKKALEELGRAHISLD